MGVRECTSCTGSAGSYTGGVDSRSALDIDCESGIRELVLAEKLLVTPTAVSRAGIERVPLPERWSSSVYRRTLDLVNFCPSDVLVLIAYGEGESAVSIKTANVPAVCQFWQTEKYDVFDIFAESA